MKTKIMLSAAFLLSALAFRGKQQQQIPVKGYKLIWNDEFNGHSLDRLKWNYRNTGKRGDAINTEGSVYNNGKGQLVIKAAVKNGVVHAGMIDTERTFQTRYGYFECRAKLTGTLGIWPSFWLQSSKNGDHGTPDKNGAEIDIFEYFPHERRDTVSHTLHYGGYGATHQKAGPALGALQHTADGFHTFGLEWTPDGYTTFVDGIKTYSGKVFVSKVPEFMILSLEANKLVAGPVDMGRLPDSFVVDYVRVYKKQ